MPHVRRGLQQQLLVLQRRNHFDDALVVDVPASEEGGERRSHCLIPWAERMTCPTIDHSKIAALGSSMKANCSFRFIRQPCVPPNGLELSRPAKTRSAVRAAVAGSAPTSHGAGPHSTTHETRVALDGCCALYSTPRTRALKTRPDLSLALASPCSNVVPVQA